MLWYSVVATAVVDDPWQTQNFQVEHGLPDSTVYSIVQDQSGYIWFGTTNGLARYDGYTFKVFKHDGSNENTISNNNAGNLFIDSKNTLWIGTFGGGVNSLDLNRGDLTRYPYSSNQLSGMVSENVQSFYEDQASNFWIGTATGLYQIKDEKITHYDNRLNDPNSLSHSRVWDITEDRNGNVWIGTSDGLSQLNLATGNFTNYKLPDELTLDISSNQFRTLYMTQDLLWVGSSSGLYSFNLDKSEFEYHPVSHVNIKVNDIYALQDGQLLIASMEGVYSFNTDNNSFVVNDDGQYWQPLAQYDIRDIYVDKSQQMWLATRDSGVMKVNRADGLFHLTQNFSTDTETPERANQVWAILPQSEGGVLLGTSETVFKSSHQAGRVSRVTSAGLDVIPGIIREIKLSKKGGYWVSSSTGIYYLSEDGLVAEFVSEPFDLVGMEPTDVFSVEETDSGELWLALYNVGILRWNPESNRAALIQNYANGSLTDLNISHITSDKFGNVWIASNLVGVFNYNFKSKQMLLYSHDYNSSLSISSNRVKDIYLDSQGRLWIATNRGLNQFIHDSNTFKRYSFSNTVLGESINNIVEDSEQNLWLGYKFGVSRFNPENAEVNHYILNSAIRNDGLITRAASIDSDDVLYFGSANGYYKFDPREIKNDTPYQPALMLTDVKINNRPLPFDQLIQNQTRFELNHDDRLIAFKFSALDYKTPEQIQYLYRLVGMHEDWLDVSVSRNIELNNLKPDQYQLEIKAINNDGRWKEQLLTIDLIINPVWWNKTWVQLLFLMFCVMLAVVFHFYRTYKMMKQNLTLEAEVDSRTTELQGLNEQLKQAANSDYLTGLPNRMAFINSYENRPRPLHSKKIDCCIVLADIDHFKKINDQYGHSAGDHALVEIGKILQSLIRAEDLIARWGGEEFIFYFENMNSEATYHLVERIRTEVEKKQITYQGHTIPVTLTFGVCQRASGMSLLDCINSADESMYLGKSQGRNKVVVATSI